MVITLSAFVSFIISQCAQSTRITTVWGVELNAFQRHAARHSLNCCRVHQTMKQLLTLTLVVIHYATIEQRVGISTAVGLTGFIQRPTNVESAATV